MSKIIKILLVWLLFIASAFAYIRFELTNWSHEPSKINKNIEFDFKKGTNLNVLSRILYDVGAVNSAYKFKWLTKLSHNYSKFQAGHYLFEKGETPSQIIDKLANGKSYSPIILTITIPEGFTLEKIVNRLSANGLGSRKEINKIIKDNF